MPSDGTLVGMQVSIANSGRAVATLTTVGIMMRPATVS